MLLNYLRVAIRVLMRQRLYTALNVAGLALGVATAAMMGLFVWHETHFDGFFRDADRIYRVLEVDHPPGRAPNRLSVLAKPLGPVLVQDIPEVEAMVRVDDVQFHSARSRLEPTLYLAMRDELSIMLVRLAPNLWLT